MCERERDEGIATVSEGQLDAEKEFEVRRIPTIRVFMPGLRGK